MKHLLLAFIFIFSLSCNDNIPLNENETTINKNSLIGCWTHDIEASIGKINLIYHRCESKNWPKSRFRHHMKFYENNASVYLNLAPDDGHYESAGNWLLDGNFLICMDTEENIKFSYEIVSLTDDELVVMKK